MFVAFMPLRILFVLMCALVLYFAIRNHLKFKSCLKIQIGL
jgi:hypothetical protein